MKEFHAALVSLLRTDAGLADWAARNFGAGRAITVLEGGRQAGQFRDAELPGALVYADEGELEPAALGGMRLEVTTGLWVLFAWRNEKTTAEGAFDAAAALVQFLELIDEMARAVIRKRTMDSAVSQAWVSNWLKDETKEPVVVGRFRVAATYQVSA